MIDGVGLIMQKWADIVTTNAQLFVYVTVYEYVSETN